MGERIQKKKEEESKSWCGSPSIPSTVPTVYPTAVPSYVPSSNPSHTPTLYPSRNPTTNPSHKPSVYPSKTPTGNPTHSPTLHAPKDPTGNPTLKPSFNPTESPSVTSSPDTCKDDQTCTTRRKARLAVGCIRNPVSVAVPTPRTPVRSLAIPPTLEIVPSRNVCRTKSGRPRTQLPIAAPLKV